MAEYFDKEGNPVEALTPEEVEEKLDEIREQTKSETQAIVDDLQTKLSDKELELATLQEELAKERSKDKNLAGQRKIIEEKVKEIDTLKSEIDRIKKDYEIKFTEIERKGKERMIMNMIGELAGSDKNLADKIKFYYDTFRPIDETNKKPEEIEKEIQERIKNAYILATGGRVSRPLTPEIISSAGGATPIINPSGEKLNPELQDLAHKLGISDAELKKHKLI